MKNILFITFLFNSTLLLSQDFIFNKSYDNINKSIKMLDFKIYQKDSNYVLLIDKDISDDWIILSKIDKQYFYSDTVEFKSPKKDIQIFIYKDKVLSKKYFLEIKNSIFRRRKTA